MARYMDKTLSALAAGAGAWFGFLFGEIDGIFTALLIFLVTDYITGILSAWKAKRLSSAEGFHGILKKMSVLVCVMVANVLDRNVLGNGAAVRSMVIFFFLANEGLSILENLGEIGVPIPKKLIESIEKLRGD